MRFLTGTLIFSGATLFNLAGTLFVVASFRLRRRVDFVLGWLVVFLAQTIVETLIFGALLRLLDPGALFVAAIIFSFAEIYFVTESPERSKRVIGELKSHLRAFFQAALRVWRHPFLVFVGLLVLAELGWQVVLAVRLPPTSFDTLTYHLIGPATWIQHHGIVHSDQSIFADTYPADQETITAWVGTFFHSLRYADLSNLPFVAMGVLCVMSLARELKASKIFAIFAALIFVSLPTVFLQTATSYVDIAAGVTSVAALYFVLVAYKSDVSGDAGSGGIGGYLFLAGCSAGLAAGVKSDNLVIAGLVGLIGLWQYVRAARAGGSVRFSISFLQLALPMAAIGGFWYVRTWITWKNPFYPISLLGFHGYGTVQTLIIGSNLPTSISHARGGALGQTVASWLFDLHRHSYAYDQRPGGFGLQWLAVLLPCLLVSLSLLWRKNRVRTPKGSNFLVVSSRPRPMDIITPRRDFILAVFVPVLGLVVSSHAAWMARYNVALMLIGCVSVAFILTRLSDLTSRWRFFYAFVELVAVASMALTMFWATSPTTYALVGAGGSFEYASFTQIAHVAAVGDGQKVLEPWPQYQVLSRIVPAGSTLAFSGANSPMFTYPLVGVRLSRSLVRLNSSFSTNGIKNAMIAAGAKYLLLGPTVSDKKLYYKITQDIEDFRPLTTGGPIAGQNVFELGKWNACGDPRFILVKYTFSAGRDFVVTARLTDSCGVAGGLRVQLFQGTQGVSTTTNSYQATLSANTNSGGYVTFNILNPPTNAQYFIRQTGGYVGSTLLVPAATKPFTPEFVPLG